MGVVRIRQSVVAVCVVAGLVGVGLTVPQAAVASEASTAWSPPAATVAPKVSPRTDFDHPWRPSVGGRFGSRNSTATKSRVAAATVSPQAAPAGTSVGAPGVGELPWFSFEKFPLTKTSIAQVNVANGNLLVKDTDLSLASPGYGFRQARFYNGLSTNTGTLGGGWGYNSSTNEIGLDLEGSYADFSGPNGTVVRFTYANSKWSAPAGSNMTLTRAGSGDFAWNVTSNRTGERYSFDGAGRLEGTFDRNGVGEYYAESGGQVLTVSAWGPNTTHSYFGYDFSQNDGTLTDLVDSAGRKVLYGYDSSQRLNTVTAPDGSATTYTYDSVGRLATITSPSAATTAGTSTVTFGYDAQNRVTTVTQQQGSLTNGAAANAVTTFSYANGVTTQTDPNGNTSSYTIDSTGRVTKTTDGRGKSRSQTWTANSDVQSSTDALTVGNVTTYQFDSNNNTTKASLPTGAAATASYSVGGSCSVANSGTAYEPKCSTDASGNKATYQYDTAGNLLQQNDTTASTAKITAKYTYETRNYATSTSGTPVCGGIAGQVCSSTDGNGNVTKNTYDSNGNLLKVTPPSPLGATTYTYDSLGRVTSVTDGKGQKTQYVYDVMDRLVKTTYANGSAVTTSYYPNGLVKNVDDSAGGSQTFQYDTRGNTTSQTGPTVENEKMTYDAAGNLASYTDASGQTKYGYDAASNVVTITDPAGVCPTGSNVPTAGSGCVQLQYDNNEKEAARVFPGGATVQTARDGAGRVTRVTAKDASGVTRADVGYSFARNGADSDGLQSRTSYLEQGITAGAVSAYKYDSRSELLSDTETSGAATSASWTYAYDSAGNRTSQILAGATGEGTGTTSYTYNAANEITKTSADTTTWAYDADGEQTRNGVTGSVLTYNSRLAVSAAGATANTYFGDGNGVRTQSGSVSFGNSALGVTAFGAAGAQSFLTRTPTGNLVDLRGTATSYYVLDASNSVIGLFDPSGAWQGGYSYTPYGQIRSAATTAAVTNNPFRYLGAYSEGNGLYKFGVRYYDSTLGRFTQQDPSGQEPNAYAYAQNDPIEKADPRGTLSVDLFVKLVQAFFAGKSLLSVLSSESLAAYGASFIFETACDAAVDTITAGLGLVIGAIGCGVLADDLAEAVDEALKD